MTVRLSGPPKRVVASGATRSSGVSHKRLRSKHLQRAEGERSQGTRGSSTTHHPKLDRALLARRARRLLREIGRPDAELSLALVDDRAIALLNERDRGRRGPTDVLSYSLLEGPHAERRGRLLGDVVISVDTASRQARARRRAMDDEVLRLLIHGVLHLLGHDHVEPEEARAMRAQERRLRRALGA